MSSYRNDQFNQIRNIETSVNWTRDPSSGVLDNNALNKKFEYPDNTIRVIKSDGTYDTRVLQKGYIRRINEFSDFNEGPVVCRFQFNPQYINQAASFQSGVVNPIYQPIEQLQQPIASMTNFSFRLFFDRSLEVNNESSSFFASDNPWETGGPGQVGVLHDINALFRVIGQGISSSDVENAIDRARETLAAGDQRLGKDSTTDEEDAIYESAVSNASRFFDNNVNVGNTAFILPYPVRIVFSSLYIVEGFVTSTALEILKFSSSYVPMQAQITLGVSAIYLGFAKQNTYFTHVLEQSAAERRNELARATDAQNADVRVLKNEFSKLHMSLLRRRSAAQDSTRPIDRPSSGLSDATIRFNQLFTDFSQSGNIRYTQPRVWAGPTNWITRSTQPGSTNRGSRGRRSQGSTPDPVLLDTSVGTVSDLFEDGALTEVTLRFRASIFGPFRDTGELRSDGRTSAFSDLFSTASSAAEVRNNSTLSRTRKAESDWKSITVTTKQQWLDLINPATSSAFIQIEELESRFPESLDVINRWLILYEAEYTVVLNGRSYVETAFNTSFLSRSSQTALTSVLHFGWNRYYNDVSETAAATSTSGPGSPSPGSVAPVRSAGGGDVPI